VIPNGLAVVGNGAFSLSGLTSITIPNSVTNIGDDAFYSCSGLTSLTIPGGVTSLGVSVFSECSALTAVTIPEGVTNIEVFAFAACGKLSSIYFEGNAPPNIDKYAFYADYNFTSYYLPGTTGWADYSEQTGSPTTLWLPQIQKPNSSFGAQANQFGFNINWASGQTVVVEACTNPANPEWQPVETNTLTTGTANFSDSQWTNFPTRFYRLLSQ
jgi:hypothetical protein